MAPPKKTASSVQVATRMSPEELTQLLQRNGWAEKGSSDSMPRIKLDANMLTTPEGGMYVYNPAKPNVPAMVVRIVSPPEEYYAIWIDTGVAQSIGRTDLEGTFSKQYINPDPDRRVWPSDEAWDDLRRAGHKGSWKGDILLQIIPEDGALKGDEPVYVLTLPTTSLIEFKGSSRAPLEGSVSDENFITKLSGFAQEHATGDPSQAVMDALESLTLGGVAAEVRLLRAENKELGRTWSVVVFDPIHVEDMTNQTPALGDGE
jgi:hypothetical protein